MESKLKVDDEKRGSSLCLVWEDLTMYAATNPNFSSNNVGPKRKILINGLSGYAESNRIMAIIGPSGSGKSTLLHALAGILPTNVSMTGNVLINGAKKSSACCRDISYLAQEDYFLGTLTVRETLTYSAHLRLHANMTKLEIGNVVTKTIAEMGLEDIEDSRIGNWHLRGISNGEKRRLSIGIELLTQPHIMFLDEPTSGLDSAAAFYVVSSLRNIAHDGRIVIISIHQPSDEVFNLFDDLIILAGGQTVYFGEITMALKFFADAGFPCPTRKNPPEHFLRCVSPEFDSVATFVQSKNINEASSKWNSQITMTTEEIKFRLLENYKNSMHSTNTKRKIRQIKLREEIFIGRTHTSRLKQLCILTSRSFLNMTRDIGYYWLRILFFILASVNAGFIYYNIGSSNEAILSKGKFYGFVYGFMIFICVGALPFYLEELKVFKRERFGRHYGEDMYVLSHFLSSLPFVIATSLSSGTILYYMVKFHEGFSHYCYFCMNLFLCISVAEGCMLFVAALVSNQLVTIVTAAGVTVFMLMPSSIFRRLADLPKFFWRYPMSYISYIAWSVQGQFKNDMIGLEFEPLVAGDPKLKGEVMLQDTFGIQTDYSKWWDLAALVFLLISYRFLFFLALKHKERASSLLQTTRTYLDILLTRTPLKDTNVSSRRHQPLYALSAQEGLSSPMS